MNIRKIVVSLACFGFVSVAGAQSIWDGAHLAHVKNHLQEPAYAVAYQHLIKQVDRQLKKTGGK